MNLLFLSLRKFDRMVMEFAPRNNFIMALWFSSLREMCPNTELFLVRIFLYSDWMQENTDQKLLRICTLFTHFWLKTKEKFSTNTCGKYTASKSEERSRKLPKMIFLVIWTLFKSLCQHFKTDAIDMTFFSEVFFRANN